MPYFTLRPFLDDRLFGAAEGNGVWLLKKPMFVRNLPLWYFSGTLAAERGGSVIEGRFRLSSVSLMRHICLLLVVMLLMEGCVIVQTHSVTAFLITAAALTAMFLILDALNWLLQLGSIRYVKRFLEHLE